jgi:pantoate--beta-alanine ligase
MITVNSIADLRALVREAKLAGKVVGFVPTMGNLHEGHLSLIDKAREEADLVVSSIFVNPMQFGENEDLDAYPRTLEADSKHLQSRGCNVLFAPPVHEIYPNGLAEETRVDVPSLGDYHCGASREGHFIGVATVVTKLFNMVQPDIAVFGEKDFQQLAIIRKMVHDLCIPVKIIGLPTSREDSGLARSSRNGYLSAEEKETASHIYKLLNECAAQLKSGNIDFNRICNDAKARLLDLGFKPDYLNIANPVTLKPSETNDKSFVILLAAHLGSTRLIDNISVSL